MFCSRTAWRRVACLVGGLCVGGALSLPGSLWAGDETSPLLIPTAQNNSKDKKKENDKESPPGLGTPLPAHLTGVPVLDLGSCKAVAATKQPALAAANASHQAALARQHGLDTISLPRFLVRNLPVRKQQAAIGVEAAQLEIQRIHLDVVYSVTYGYLSAQYAAEQRAMLEDARTKLLELRKNVAAIAGEKVNIRKEDIARIDVTLKILDSRRAEAAQGEQRAMSALREALGVDAQSPLVLRACGLPRLTPHLDKDQVVAMATCRRPEVQQAALLSQVHGLEVEAQGTRRLFPTAPTFASGSDIHYRPIPSGRYDDHYRPAALAPEMPVTINGSKSARAEIASAYEARSGSVVDKTKNLMALEAEQAYYRYLEASRKLPLLKEALEKALEVFEETRLLVLEGSRFGTVPNLLASGTQVTELRGQINQTRYQALVALAGLERATACGFQAGFETAPTTDPPAPPKPPKPKEERKKDDDEAGKVNGRKQEQGPRL